ncbi:YbaB/EbfC family nucleoid-associated protein [Solihabitans fulvus]|uniref:YbaB/EbfC family nucleoid-associated protein n=1 Tax=Solihabitans fulvus TaxID=1892852 RepID=A0A5B2XMZ1_9PSEU|nr:YbaB/EbfC family nucleoid-associated protein [Solihabitans fulvus]KAA2264743.1 YbaB/EbfC family nucleoid-associated protein [Solihabitans fulvus]
MATNDWVASYGAEVGNIAEAAEQAKAQLQLVASTLTSKDGAVTVTVNASGALQNLSFGPRADELPRAQLAAAIVATAHRAQAAAARQVTAVMAPLIGTDSDAMKFLEEQIPTPEEPEEESPASEPEKRVVFNEERASEFRPAPPAAPPRPPAPQTDGDEDEGHGPVLKRGGW